MKNVFLSTFKDLYDCNCECCADDIYSDFINRFGAMWATDVVKYVPELDIKNNRKGFHEFYFDKKYAQSVKSDPRSGMFVRAPDAEGGKIELLIHQSLGLEGFSQLIKVKREIDGINKKVILNGDELPIDITGYEDSRAAIDHLMNLPEADWDDSLIRPNYESALILAKDAFLDAEKANSFDEPALMRLLHVVLCGAHCPGSKPRPEVASKMSEIHVMGGAIRAAAKELKKSLN
ncbi:MAG: hypothetical protein U1D41_16795 [Nitrosomonas sp.]|uniref:hypothetical protein n=1 Tax=Nitrosomonas sp. TaxID=42353 RepID=UPI00277A79EC|nr:hypothetical protein [Nitrosomonas sp.]MDP3608644.1 hypothetical protein [Methylophilus sp.]MDZ4107770.1 hypothetical protein [Nitrosomonas sp.]